MLGQRYIGQTRKGALLMLFGFALAVMGGTLGSREAALSHLLLYCLRFVALIDALIIGHRMNHGKAIGKGPVALLSPLY